MLTSVDAGLWPTSAGLVVIAGNDDGGHAFGELRQHRYYF